MQAEHIVQTLQASVAPCLLISGFGFLLLTMTNRLGRAADLIRNLNNVIKQAPESDKKNLCEQIAVLFQRCQHLQSAIALLTFSISFVSLNVLLLFVMLAFHIDTAFFVELFFASSLICLIVSLFFFMLDIRITLKSIRIAIGPHLRSLNK